MKYVLSVGANHHEREAKKVACAGRLLKIAQAHVELAGFNPLQDRRELSIEQLNTLVRSVTPEPPHALRQNIGRDQGLRSERNRLTASFCSSSNARHCGAEFL